MTKLIICGSRTIVPYTHATRTQPNEIELIQPGLMFSWIDAIVEQAFPPITEVISGRAQGADQFGELWAQSRGIPVKPFPVKPEEWRLLGKSAGMVRNRKMGDYAARSGADNAGVLAIWDGKSHGTQGMLDYAGELGIKRVVLKPDGGWYILGG